MATCLCDAFYDDVARATVGVLEFLGCVVEFPEAQTCCGQPAFNAGDWPAARLVVRHTTRTFAGDLPIVVPSASCTAMMVHGAPLAFEHEPDVASVGAIARRAWELADFIVHALGVTSWPGRYDAHLAMHRACHARGTHSGDAMETLLGSISGLTVAPIGDGEQCCGFGGTFAVSFPNISGAMGVLKLENIRALRADAIVSGDMSCLMHLGGLAAKEGAPVRGVHVAQVLRDALRNGGLL